MRLFFTVILALMPVLTLGSISRAEEEALLNPERAFYRANMLYEAGDYDDAINANKSILKKGLKSGNIYYNLGNSYFKKGKLGEAILSYERAKLFMPRDSDLLSNYKHAKALIKRKPPPEKGMRVLKRLRSGMDFLTLKETVSVTIVFYYLLMLYVVATKVFGKMRGFSTFIIAILGIGLIILLIPLEHKIKDLNRRAIVVSGIEDARFEPLKDATVHFSLYEGTGVYVLREKDDWAKVKRSDGKVGWVRKEAVGLIGSASPL